MKSSTLWILAYLWRWVNPIMLIQYSMVAVLYNKAYEYLVREDNEKFRISLKGGTNSKKDLL